MLKNSKRSVTPSRETTSKKKVSMATENNTENYVNNQQQHHQQQNTNNLHWNDLVQETVLSAANPEQLYFELIGGADEGQFPHIGEMTAHPEDVAVSVRGSGLDIGDVILDIQGQKVSGFTGNDVQERLRQCLSNGRMVVVRAVPKGKKIMKINDCEIISQI